jgi:hypothetical protein
VSRVNNSGAGRDGRGKAAAGRRKARKVKGVAQSPRARVRANGRMIGRPFQSKAPPERKVVRVVDLDPFERCGRGTSVQRLIRVDEIIDHERETHLVFFDRHGWYCEHGTTCPAVGHARKHAERSVRSH